MDTSPQLTRLVQALKGTGRLANPKSRVVIQSVTTRDQSNIAVVGWSLTVTGRTAPLSGDTATVLTDTAGNAYAMTDMAGFAEGAIIF